MKFSRTRETGGIKSLPGPSGTASVSATQESTNSVTASLLKYGGQLPYSDSSDITTDATSSYISVSQDGSTMNVSSANYSPGKTKIK